MLDILQDTPFTILTPDAARAYTSAVEAEYKEEKQEEVAEPAPEDDEAAPAPAMEDE